MLLVPFCERLLLHGDPPLLLREGHPSQTLIMRGLDGSESVSRRTGRPSKACLFLR